MSDDDEGGCLGTIIVLGLFGLSAAGVYHLFFEDDKPKEVKQEKVVQETKRWNNILPPTELKDYTPVSVEEIAKYNNGIRVSAVPTKSVRVSNELYMILFEQDGKEVYAVADQRDLVGTNCSVDAGSTQGLHDTVAKIIESNKSRSQSGKKQIRVYGQNVKGNTVVTESGEHIILHKAKVGKTVYDIMRCKQ